MAENRTGLREAAASTAAQESDSLRENWVYILVVLLILLLIVFVSCLCYKCRGALRHSYRQLRTPRWKSELSKLRYKVECYGKGNIHQDLLMDGYASNPCVLVVYKVSRETEDLRNALKWVETDQEVQREDICAVILLEKVSKNHEKPVDVDHEGVFDDRTVVVRILWGQESRRFLWEAHDKIHEGPRLVKAMEKVIWSIKERQCN